MEFPQRLAGLPATGQVNSIDGRWVGQDQLQLCIQGEVIRRNMGVRATSNIVFNEPVGIERPQDAQDVEVGFRIEDVINHAL